MASVTRFVTRVLGTSIQEGDERLVVICNWYPAVCQEISIVFPEATIVNGGTPPVEELTVTLTGLDVLIPPWSSVARAVSE